MKRALLIVLVLMLVLVPVLTSCGKPPATSESPDEATPIPTGTKNDLYVWWDSNANAMTVIQNAILDFFEANPEYQGNKTISAYTPASQDRMAFEINVAGNTAPNIIRMDHVYIAALGANKNITDLRDYGFDQEKDKFIQSTWDGVVYKNGPIYGMPFDANTIALMYNKDILNQAGVGVPTTYDELIAAGNAIKAQGDDSVWPYTLSVNDRDNWSTFNYLFWLWRLGGEVLNTDYTKARFNEQEGIDALNMYIELTNTYKLADPAGYHEGDFGSGKLAMIDMGQWWINGVSQSENYAFAPMIKLKDDVPNHSGLGLYAISVTSEKAGNLNVPLSYEFAKFLCMTPEYSINYCKPGNVTPSLIEASQDEYFNDEIHKVFIDQLQIAKARPGVACWPAIEEAIHNALNEVMNQGRSASEALNAAAATVNQLLADEAETAVN